MLRPTKGGLKLRGVTFSLEALSQALASAGQSAVSYDDLLGDRVSVVAELEQVGGAAKREPERAAVQRRSGVCFVARELVSATLEAEAEQIEGVVARSKGFFSVSQHLVSRDDLNWALPGGKDAAGERVRLWGQPRTVHCHPEAQCLLGGSLPMFDVARAERVP